MPPPEKQSRDAPAYGLHPQFRQVYGESFAAAAEGGLLRIGVGSMVPQLGDDGTTRRIVTDFELLIDPDGGRYLAEVLSKWLETIAAATRDAEDPRRHE